MNCKWDEAIGCYAANGKSPTVGAKSSSSAIKLKAKETKGRKFGPNIDDTVQHVSRLQMPSMLLLEVGKSI